MAKIFILPKMAAKKGCLSTNRTRWVGTLQRKNAYNAPELKDGGFNSKGLRKTDLTNNKK